MSILGTSGTTLGICLDEPASLTAAGFGALTYITVGEITDFGAFSRQWQLAEHKPVATRMTKSSKGGYDPGSQSFTMAKDFTDAGQEAVAAAFASTDNVSIKINFPNGKHIYYIGLVTKDEMNAGGVDSNVAASFDVKLNCDPILV